MHESALSAPPTRVTRGLAAAEEPILEAFARYFYLTAEQLRRLLYGQGSLRYAQDRKAFGRTISRFQAIQWKLADNATRIEAARLLTYHAAYLKDRGRRTTLESAMAKLYASEIAVRAADDCVQIHGGYGFVKDYPAEKFFRDVKLTTIGEGTSEILRLVIARQLLSR